MKNKYVKFIAVIAFGSFLLSSCNEGESDMATAQISSQEAIDLVAVVDVSEDAESIVDDYLAFETGISAKSEIAEKTPQFLDCRVKTIVIEGKTKTVTIDFGDGCEMPNGNVLKGKIIITHQVDEASPSLTIKTSYENYYVNDLKVEGGSTIVRTKSNENGNPQSSIVFEKKVTWAEGEFKLETGNKVKEWVEGYNTRDWKDNVSLTTGNWSTTFKDGTVCSVTITEPLRREATCRFIVSGIVDLVKGERTGTINFGDGTCDEIAIFTNQLGEEKEIKLRSKKEK